MSEKRSWLEGPQLPGENEAIGEISSYPGESFGIPKEGPGSLASLFSRMGALLIDWIICMVLAWLITLQTDVLGHYSTLTWLLFLVWRTISVWLFAQSPGHAVMGIGVGRIDKPDERVGFVRALVRTFFTLFLFPPIIQDTDGRGMHDRATGTAVVRVR
ncbi:RDD family protein [Corynebacterium resistens]|uniref:RDD family protein n=1 Tax=Corynebacterium resistens TaxID=258224 RepID=UPI0023575F64|nr:RDD family protein [Corynebacterium resistens]